MGSLENLAQKLVNGDSQVMKWTRPDGEVVVAEDGYETGKGDMWSGSIGAWQAALLVALSAKFVEGTLVVAAPIGSSKEERDATATELSEYVECSVVVMREDWRAYSAEERVELRRALSESDDPCYPQLTDWVRAQPGGTFLLVVCSADEPVASFASADAHKKVVTMIHEADLSPVSFGYGDDYQAVWLSRHVSPNCESKIPRGVKVYRER